MACMKLMKLLPPPSTDFNFDELYWHGRCDCLFNFSLLSIYDACVGVCVHARVSNIPLKDDLDQLGISLRTLCGDPY